MACKACRKRPAWPASTRNAATRQAYSGTGGYVGIAGQGYSPGDDWPKIEMASLSRRLYNNVQRVKLNVDQILPLHGRQFPGQTSQESPPPAVRRTKCEEGGQLL